MIRFTCVSCQETLEVPDSRAGQLETCSACGQAVRVPAAPPSPPAPQPPPPAIPPATGRKYIDPGPRTILGVAGLVLGILTAAVGALGVMALGNPRGEGTISAVFWVGGWLMIFAAVGVGGGGHRKQVVLLLRERK